MATIHEWVDDAGGALHKRQLVALGARDRDLTRAVRSGDVKRARRGWYTTFDTGDPRFIALRVGGRLTGAAALQLLGAWMWSRAPPLVVSVPSNAARLRRKKGVRVVYDSSRVTARGSNWAVDRRDALVRAVIDTDEFDDAVILLDWAVTSGLFSHDDFDEVTGLLPHYLRGVATWANSKSQSLLESSARVFYELRGHRVACQVPVGPNQLIDLLIDDTVALELDGYEFHHDRFEQDRRKDAEIAREGWFPLRASYNMVKNDWRRVMTAVDSALSRHLAHAPPGGWTTPSNRASPSKPRHSQRWRCPLTIRTATQSRASRGG